VTGPDPSQVGPLREALESLVEDLLHTAEDQSDRGSTNQAPAARHLRRMRTLTLLSLACAQATDHEAASALKAGASFSDVGPACGITKQAARRRFAAKAGNQVVVVISRRRRIHRAPGGHSERFGEVGGAAQYASDRKPWAVGDDVRTAARHAVVAVDGIVKRVYEIDPAHWQPCGNHKWAFEGRPLTPGETALLHNKGTLPFAIGDACPTRAGGAYRPHWF